MKTQLFRVIQLIMIVVLCNLSLQGQQRLTEAQADQIFAQWNKPDIPGVSVSVISDGKIIFKKGYGLASLEHGIPSGSSTVYQVASVSKQITAYALLLLESQGKLSLDDNIGKYLPEMPAYAGSITLKHLIYHTSGLRDYWELLAAAGWRYDDVITREQVFELVCRQKGLTSRPGSEEIYNNTGYMLLAEIVSRVSGMSFAKFAQENIFKPLRMTQTVIIDDNGDIVKNAAVSYHLSDGTYKKSLLNNNVAGSTNLYTTVDDMSHWALNLEHPVVGRRMLTRGTLDNGDSTNYAMGLDTGPYRGLMLIGHRGAEAGYRSFFGMFPSQKLTVIVFSNNAEADPTSLALKIADLLLKDKFPPENEVQQVKTAIQYPGEYKGSESVLSLCAGQYELRPGFIISITSEDGGLYAEAHELPKSHLMRTSENEFTLPSMNAKLTFSGDDVSSINRLNVDLNGQLMVAPRLKDFDPGSVKADEFSGVFYSSELNSIYSFDADGCKLVVKNPRMNDLEMQATATDQFSADKRRAQFLRSPDGRITGFMYSSGRISNVLFRKIEQ